MCLSLIILKKKVLRSYYKEPPSGTGFSYRLVGFLSGYFVPVPINGSIYTLQQTQAPFSGSVV